MNGKLAWGVVTVLFVVIIVLTWILLAVPKPAEAPTVSTSSPQATATSSAPEPLHTRVAVSSPPSGSTVGQRFVVIGEAPGNWYFEAVFPIQVRDKDNNKIGQAQGQAQADWMTTGQVPFSAEVTLDTPYRGPATIVLLKDNPSGLPENDDSLEVPVVIQ